MTSDHHNPPAEPAPALLAEFRQRAEPILARERGFTPACVVKLNRLAHELAIPAGHVDAAILSLSAKPLPPPVPLDPQVEKFRQRLRKDLAGKSRTILGPTIEAQIVATAQRKYSLGEDVARQAFAEVAAELGLRRITADDAVRSLEESIQQATVDSTWLAKESRDRLRSVGLNWGLDIEVVDELIEERLVANRADLTRRQFRNKALLMGSAGAVAVVALVLLALSLNSGKNAPGGTMPTGDSTAAATKKALPRRGTAPPWWDVELTLAVSQARGKVDGFGAVYNGLIAESVSERQAAYGELIALARRVPLNKVNLQLLTEVITGSHALEPDEGAAAELRQALLTTIPAPDASLPKSTDEYGAAYWAVHTGLECLAHRGLSSERAADLARLLQEKLGAPVNRSLPPVEAEQAALAALTGRLYQQLAVAATRQPGDVPPLQKYVARQASSFLPAQEADKLAANFLAAALLAPDADWQSYQSLIATLTAARDPLLVLKLLEVYERTRDESLRLELEKRFLARLNSPPASSSVADVARAVRQALGAASPSASSQRERWALLRGRADAALALPVPAPSAHEQLLRETAELAHLATLACALAQGESASPVFDELVQRDAAAAAAKSEPPADVFDPPPVKRPARVFTAIERQMLDRLIQAFENFAAVPAVQRESNIRALAQLAYELPDLTPRQAEAVARYILAEKTESEQAALLKPLGEMRRWKYLRLAIADGLETAKLTPEQLAALAGALLGEERTPTSAELRAALRSGVYYDLQAVPRTTIAPSAEQQQATEIDAAAAKLLASYRTRARLLGVAPAAYQAAETPTQALEAALAALAASSPRSGAATTGPAMPFALTAADYLAETDLQRTLARLEIWLEYTARRLALVRPERAAAAAKMLAAAQSDIAVSANCLVQLRAAEAGNLRLWLLYEGE